VNIIRESRFRLRQFSANRNPAECAIIFGGSFVFSSSPFSGVYY